MKAETKRLRLDRPVATWLEDALNSDPRLELLPLSTRVSVAAAGFSCKHGDPADRMIVAIAYV